MSGRFFLDTNIFIYTFDSKAPAKAKKAVQLIRRAADTGEGIISYQVVQEFFNVALRRFPQPMNAAEAEQYLITVLRPLLAVHSSPAIYLGSGVKLRPSGRRYKPYFATIFLGQGFLLTY
jgi:predicted nucleic acid-binding protein